jgi:hypothetical protein
MIELRWVTEKPNSGGFVPILPKLQYRQCRDDIMLTSYPPQHPWTEWMDVPKVNEEEI